MMKNTTKLKAIVLSLLMLIGLLPLTSFAQSDGFIFNEDEISDRDAWAFTLNTQNFGATPVGSGLLILGIAGAGYAVAKRRRSKRDITKGTALLLAGLMLVGMTNCRKKVDTIASVGDKVHITVKVNGGSKAGVNPTNGEISFNNGDYLYVGYNGAKVGELTYSTGSSSFGGDITISQSGDQPLYFYYLGGPAATVVDATHYTANISDQTSNYPVIATGPSTTNYEDGTKAYTVDLTNKCGFVKFATNVNSTTVNVGGMNTKATLDFSTGEITPGTEGTVSFSTDGEGTGWAILLVQDAVDDATVTASGYSDGTCDVPAVTNNMLYSTGVSVTLTPAPSYTLLSAATTTDYGKVVCAAGHLHDAKTAVPVGCTAVGILGKVTETGHGLILALQDATAQTWNTIKGWTSVNTYADTELKVLPDNAARGSLTSYTTLGSTTVSNWAVAQKSDYDAIFTNLGSTTGDSDGNTYDSNVNAYIITGVGGTAISGSYWSATEESDDAVWDFYSDAWYYDFKTMSNSVRPVLAF